MGLHKIIEAGGEQYLPFALNKMRQLIGEAATQWGTASRVIYADDGAVIRLRVNGDEQHLHITAGSVKYQFTSTGPVMKRGRAEELSYDLPLGHGVQVRIEKGKVEATPLGSTAEADTDKPPRWPYSSKPPDMGGMLTKKNVWQLQHVSEHVYYPRGAGKTGVAKYPFLVNCWAPSTGVLCLLTHSGLPNSGGGYTDVMYDASPSLFRSGGEFDPLGESGLAPDSDWYRRAATCVVKHPEHGSRRFIVMVTADNKFHVYPTSSDVDLDLMDQSPYRHQHIKTNVPEKFVRRAAAPMPAWCRQSGVVSRDAFADALTNPEKAGRYAREVPQYSWHFDSACTKVCCVVFEDLEQPEGFNAGEKQYHRDPKDSSLPSDEEVQETLPGLLELGIDIALTGKGPEDFSFGLRVLQALRPSVDGRYFLAADYSWVVPAKVTTPAPKEPPPNIADRDDLVVITGHVYHTSPTRERLYEPVRLDAYAGRGLLRVRNLTKGTTVREFVVYDTNEEYMREYSSFPNADGDWGRPRPDEKIQVSGMLIAHDLRILAFAVQQKFWRTPLITHANQTQSPDAPSQVQRLQVYAYNKLVQEKYLDPGHPLNPRLDAAHAAVGTSGLFEFPCNEIGLFEPAYTSARIIENPPHPMWYGWRPYQSAYYFLGMAPVWYSTYIPFATNGWYARGIGPICAGALLYSQLVLPAVAPEQPSVYDKFAVHPDGGWSLVTLPFFYYSGGAAAPYPAKEYISVDAMRQGRLDIICLRAGKKDVMTTHLECLNKAYEKTWKEEEFLYRFSILTRPDAYGKTWMYLGLHLANDPTTGAVREAFIHCGGGVSRTEPKLFKRDIRRFVPLYTRAEAQAFEEEGGTTFNRDFNYTLRPTEGLSASSKILSYVPFSGASALFF